MLSMVVIGCKQSVDSGDTDWTTDEKDHKVWEKRNESSQYLRAFKQFGTSTNVTGIDTDPIVARLEVGNLTASKAGLMFGLNKYSEQSGTYSYFLVGVGGHGYGTSQGEYFITYNYDVTPEQISQSSNNQTAAGNSITIKNNTTLESGSMSISGSLGYVFVSVSEEKDTSQNKSTVTITIGNQYDEKKKEVTGTTTKATFEIGSGATSFGDVTEQAQKDKLKTVEAIKGGIAAYGMLKPASTGTATSTKNDYQIKNFGGTLALSAEEAE